MSSRPPHLSTTSGSDSPTSLVVTFQADARALPDPSHMAVFPERVVRISKQAEALGGTLCSFGPLSVSFAFGETELEDWIAWSAEVTHHATAIPRFSCGMSCGALAPIAASEGQVALAWGKALVLSAVLATSAHPGEVLVDPDIPGVLDVVRSTGTRWVSGGETAVAALSLDPRKPLLSDSVSMFVEPEELKQAASASTAATAADQARQALVRGDVESLDAALAELTTTGANPGLAKRLAGLIALDRGAKDDGLRMLRQAAEAEQRPEFKTRAQLAYAIALASAGRPESALLEALTALGLARTMQDRAGEVACARFLAQLSKATGHAVAASVWERIAALA
ncbi:MAG: hypothetical protein U0414_30220 [Polyangiaceae bacterium]